MSILANKRALVLGGSRGIGAAIVRRLVKDGADVTFTYSGSAEAAQTLASETGAKAVQSDSASREATVRTVGEAGPLDILVVNAGVAMIGEATELDPDGVDRMIDIGLGDMIFDRPALKAWYERYAQRPAFQKTFYEGARLTDIFGKDAA